jgi:AcrR family transcriptional regulator
MISNMPNTRAYRSPRREHAAAQTRHDIVDAARRLFLRAGYAQVTVADIAREAGTAVKTVYSSMGGKTEILNEIVSAAVTDSGAEQTVVRVQQATDLATVLAIVARGTRLGNEHHRDAIAILNGAMVVHQSAEALWEQGTSLYRHALVQIAEHLEVLGALPPGMSVARAADVLWFCFGLSSWRTLIHDCGWTWDEAEAWLARKAATLLAD